MTLRQLGSFLLPLAAATVLAGCSGSTTASTKAASTPTASSPTSATTSTPATATKAPATTSAAVLTIKNFMYIVPASVKAGSTVMVKNVDGTAHTVTIKGSPALIVQPGATATLTAPAKPGTYPITCDFHGNMKADLVVS